MKNYQTNYYLPDYVRTWVAKKAIDLKISRSNFLYKLIKTAMEEDDETTNVPKKM